MDRVLLKKRHMLCNFTSCFIFFIWLESLFGLLMLFVTGVSFYTLYFVPVCVYQSCLSNRARRSESLEYSLQNFVFIG